MCSTIAGWNHLFFAEVAEQSAQWTTENSGEINFSDQAHKQNLISGENGLLQPLKIVSFYTILQTREVECWL